MILSGPHPIYRGCGDKLIWSFAFCLKFSKKFQSFAFDHSLFDQFYMPQMGEWS